MGRTKRSARGQSRQQRVVVVAAPSSSSPAEKTIIQRQAAPAVETVPKAEKKRRKRKRKQSYAVPIFRVLRQICTDIKISKNAMNTMDCFMQDVFQRIASEAALLMRYNKRVTLAPIDVESATKLVLNGALAKHAVHCGASAVVKYFNATFQDDA